ncbi:MULTISPECIES: M28 family metallopeptidase [unclassified Rhodococcus (in: high G+C Gram-positive bacteria)]|uniref:M28 family metallopeptidase n=1 Tax=unclassified Rhodococcus (in: high G+C Gram-positive bacteria) TaxID=192944 RepID=UPI0029555607|nr:M28 family metallopeptidase [Rhodococcus sp. IEGM 1318]MDV8003225.1 M28 family metallopeptidase [Rhodococcus sp. IEGM 1318]MDZ7911291.1 M28 family metallopeptidase [Rhodococcus sp. (in: high G+C Gram-positive bacteria)]
MRLFGVVVVGMAGALVVSGCSSGSEAAVPTDPVAFSETVTVDAVTGHLEQLEKIAANNDGNRSAGTPGYDASVDYVANLLEDKGFDVSTPEFDFSSFDPGTESLKAADGSDVPVRALTYSTSTGPTGITARLVAIPADETPGCEATDYDGRDVNGAIVLVTRGVCPFGDKQKIAADRGAAALLVANNEDAMLGGATLGEPEDARIPTGGVSKASGEALAAAPGDLTLILDTSTETTKSRNVIAQTKTGATDNVVVVGAHLDSVPEGPGINDNGTGTAAVLETALQMGGSPSIENAVRFAFWGAEEVGLVGSTRYVEGLSDQDRADIALYLNFDMLGSPNAGYLAYDGDNSDAVGEGPGPEGSAGIERTFVDFLAGRGIAADGTDFDGRSDYGPFIEIGIPAGGVFSGADERKTPAQAEKWGGEAEETFDPNYHSAQDNLANIDREALAVNASAVAFGVATYSQDLSGPNGVPVGDARTQARTE